MPTETTLNSLKVHKVPDFETWEENYNQTNGIGTSDVVVIPPEELKKGVLPDQTNNSGKFLTTDGNGNTSWATVDALPSQSGNSGKYLKTNGSAASWENAPVTSVNSKTGAVTLDNTDVGAAASSHSHGNITNEGDITATAPTIANGDQIIINDNSASKITNGPTFDGSTTTKYLSQKGTWESVPTINYPVTSVNSKTGAVSLSASDVNAVATSAVGANSGVAPLNASGKIDSTYLPSYVDDVIEGYYYNSKFYTTSAHTTEITGETGKIFVDLSTNKTYRYGGSSFTEISQGSVVSVSRDLTSGTKIGTLTINGTGTDLYAPTPETFTVTGGASTIISDNLTANRALISNASGKVAVSDVTSTELGYLDGVTSAIQTQINGKQAKITASGILKGDGSGGVSAATAGTDYPPVNHASTATTYGVGTSSNYGHVKLSDSTSSTNGTSNGIAATPAAVKAAYDKANNAVPKIVSSNPGSSTISHTWSGFSISITTSVDGNNSFAVNSDSTEIHNVVTPTAGGDAVPKSYVDNAISNIDALPSQTNNSGKFLTTNGSSASWEDIPEEVFVAVIGVTTYNEIATAIAENKIIFVNAYGSGHLAPRESGWFYFIDSTMANSSEINLRSHGPVKTVSFTCTNNDEWSSSTSDNSATSSRFGHVILSDSTSSTSSTSDGIAATPAAVKAAYDLAVARTKIYTATCSTGASTAAKVATLDDSTGFSLAAGVKVAVTFTYGNSATTPTLNVNSSGAKTIAIPSSATAYTTGNGTTYNTWGAYETVLFTYTGTYWAHIPSGYLGYLAYNTASGRQAKITASGILKGDGSGGVTAATAGTDYAAASHTHGNITSEGDITATAPTIANGDQLIINDDSAGKITNGPTFDGSTTNQFLSKKGTWQGVSASDITNMGFMNWNNDTLIDGASILKTDNNGTIVSAIAGTDYVTPASPTFTGIPVAPTATAGTNTTQIATTAFVKTAVQNATVKGTISLNTTWNGSGPYTKTLTISYYTVTANTKVDIQLTPEQIAQLITDGVTGMVISNDNGTLTLYAIGAKPTTSMTIQVTYTEVA